MTREYVWRPSFFGRLFTGSPPWSLRLINGRFELHVNDERVEIDLERGDRISVHRGVLWGRLSFRDGILSGLPNTSVASLNEEITGVMGDHQRLVAERLAEAERLRLARVERFKTAYELVTMWLAEAERLLTYSRAQRRWVTHEQQMALQAIRPELPMPEKELDTLLEDEDLRKSLGVQRVDVQTSLVAFRKDWTAHWATENKAHTDRERVASSKLLSNVEKRALNDEQAEAVICLKLTLP